MVIMYAIQAMDDDGRYYTESLHTTRREAVDVCRRDYQFAHRDASGNVICWGDARQTRIRRVKVEDPAKVNIFPENS